MVYEPFSALCVGAAVTRVRKFWVPSRGYCSSPFRFPRKSSRTHPGLGSELIRWCHRWCHRHRFRYAQRGQSNFDHRRGRRVLPLKPRSKHLEFASNITRVSGFRAPRLGPRSWPWEARVDITLQTGETSQTVTVTEALPLDKTTSATLTDNLTAQTIAELPLNGRNFVNLLTLTPGYFNSPGGGGRQPVWHGDAARRPPCS